MTMVMIKSKIPEQAGGSLVEFVTDEDGDVKDVWDWLGSGSAPAPSRGEAPPGSSSR